MFSFIIFHSSSIFNYNNYYNNLSVHFYFGNNVVFDEYNDVFFNYIRKEKDISFQESLSLSIKQKKVLKQTLDNVASFIKKLIQVVQTNTNDSKIKIGKKSVQIGKHDLYVDIRIGNFSVKGAESNGFGKCTYQDNNGKPIAGFIILQAKKIPEEAQDFYTKDDREFFEIIFHELCHILGFSKSLITHWRNPDTFQNYNQSKIILKCVNKHDMCKNKIHNILRTPRIVKYLKERYDIDDNEDECDVGAEFEDSYGNIGSHLEARTYYNEIMTGTSMGYSRISNVTLNILEDIGFYKVNKIYAEPLEFGDNNSLPHINFPKHDFLFGPPEITFPSHYLVDYKNDLLVDTHESCSYDHRAIVRLMHKTRNCQENDKSPECFYPGFYDSLNRGKYGDIRFDFARIGIVKHVCHKSKNNIEKDNKCGSYFGPDSRCALSTLNEHIVYTSIYVGCFKMKCNKKYELTIFIDDKSGICKCKGEKLTFPNYKGFIICPDPFIVCGIDNYPNKEFNEDLKKRCRPDSRLYIYKRYRIADPKINQIEEVNTITSDDVDTILEYNHNQITFEISSAKTVLFDIDKLLTKNITIVGCDKEPSSIILHGADNKTYEVGENRYHKFHNVYLVNSGSKNIIFNTLELRKVYIKSNLKFSSKGKLDTDMISFKNLNKNFKECYSIIISGELSEIQEIHFYKAGIIAIESCCNIRASKDDLDIANDVYIDGTMISTQYLTISVTFKESESNKLDLLIHPNTSFIRHITINLIGNTTKVVQFFGDWNVKNTKSRLIIDNKEGTFITYGRRVPAYQIANQIINPNHSTKFILIIIIGFIGNILLVVFLFMLFTKFGYKSKKYNY